jgi:hypothetical protein
MEGCHEKSIDIGDRCSSVGGSLVGLFQGRIHGPLLLQGKV